MAIVKGGNASIDLIRDGWMNPEGATALNSIYVSATSFRVDGDLTDVFTSGRGVKIDFQTTGIIQCTVSSSSYDGGTDKTTVNVGGETLVNEVINELLVSASDLKKDTRVFSARDEKAVGVGGGTFTSGAWQTRTINTVDRNTIPGASLAANVITIPAGTYYVEADCPAYSVSYHQALLRDKTNSVTLVRGTSEYAGAAVTNKSFIRGHFTAKTSITLEVWHRCSATQATIGFGTAASLTNEIYTTIVIRKLD